MHRLRYIILIFLTVSFTTVSCQNANEGRDDFNMTASQLKEAMLKDSNLVILDVRTPPELVGQHGQIEGVINIPVQELSARVDEMLEHKDKNIAVICRSGNRSVFATKLMQSKGYKAKNVLGGMKAFNKL